MYTGVPLVQDQGRHDPGRDRGGHRVHQTLKRGMIYTLVD